VALNLKDPDGVTVALRLIERADVLLEGYRPGVMERLGLGPDACLSRNPRLVYGRMTGWGQTGPLALRAGHDITYIALTGALHAIGPASGPPVIPLNLLGDFAGGSLYLVAGVLAALVERTKSGRGQVVDAAIVDGTASLLTQLAGFLSAGIWTDARGKNLLDGGAPWYAVYETADGGHVAVGAIEPKFYDELVSRLGLATEDLPGQWDTHRWPVLREALAAAFRRKTRDEWGRLFADSDACVAPVLSLTEAAAHPHLDGRHVFVERHGIREPAPAPRFSRTPTALTRPPCRLGEHTEEVLRDVDLTDEEIADLRAREVVGTNQE
jgi:alpha-methylacyl-CoA racemase